MPDPLMLTMQQVGAIVKNSHFVYKAGTHGGVYINKEMFVLAGARKIQGCLSNLGMRAWREGLNLTAYEEVVIVGPAKGAIGYAPLLAFNLETYHHNVIKHPITCIFSRTDLDENGSHIIPDKLLETYGGRPCILIEDIVNNGITIREVAGVIRKRTGAKIIAALGLVDRSEKGHTAEGLGVPFYLPYSQMPMPQFEPSECPLCAEGVPINTMLGKGKKWVDLFGQPTYAQGTDFSAFYN